jgi:hypothetical protein
VAVKDGRGRVLGVATAQSVIAALAQEGERRGELAEAAS